MTMIICYAYTFIQGRSRERAQKEKQKRKSCKIVIRNSYICIHMAMKGDDEVEQLSHGGVRYDRGEGVVERRGENPVALHRVLCIYAR